MKGGCYMHPIFVCIPMVISVILACVFEDTSKVWIPAWLSIFITDCFIG